MIDNKNIRAMQKYIFIYRTGRFRVRILFWLQKKYGQLDDVTIFITSSIILKKSEARVCTGEVSPFGTDNFIFSDVLFIYDTHKHEYILCDKKVTRKKNEID